MNKRYYRIATSFSPDIHSERTPEKMAEAITKNNKYLFIDIN